MHVNMYHVKKLVEIITRHGQLGKFSVHTAHQHDPIPKDTVRLESDFRVMPGKWNKATSIDSLDLSNIHPVVFKFFPEKNRYVAFEFGEGPSPVSASDVDDKFIQEFTGYLTKNNLTEMLVLEVVHPAEGGQPNECTAEVEVDKLGTVVLPKSMVNAKVFLPTGWASLPPPPPAWRQ
jgi:hypothetical protein